MPSAKCQVPSAKIANKLITSLLTVGIVKSHYSLPKCHLFAEVIHWYHGVPILKRILQANKPSKTRDGGAPIKTRKSVSVLIIVRYYHYFDKAHFRSQENAMPPSPEDGYVLKPPGENSHIPARLHQPLHVGSRARADISPGPSKKRQTRQKQE